MEQQFDKNSSRKNPPPPLETGIEDRDLRIEVFAVCEAALDQSGRLTVLGVFENINASQIPCVMPPITIALRLRFWPGEIQQHAVKFVVTNPDGRPITQMLEGSGFNPAGSHERSQACNVIAQIQNLAIDEAGEYRVDFYLNDRLEGRLPFCVLSGAV